jgi:hypothetical protein
MIMKMMNTAKIAFALAWLYLAGTNALAQGQNNNTDDKNPYKGLPFKERIFFGGDFGLAFGDFTYIRLNPMLGYNVNRKLQVGAGPSYQYLSFRVVTPFNSFRRSMSIYGGTTFARLFILENFFAQSTFEVLNLESVVPNINAFGELVFPRVTIPVWFVGGGYVQRSGRGGFMIGGFVDLIQDPNSPYGRGLRMSVGGFF